MISVRYPNGVCIRYRTANYVRWGMTDDNKHILYTDSTENNFVATVPIDCAVEFEEGEIADTSDLRLIDALLDNTARFRKLDGYRLKLLKRALAGFNAKTKRWE